MSYDHHHPADPSAVSSELPERFLSAFWRIHRRLRAGTLSQDGHQITRVQWLILRQLKRTEQCTIGQLADRMEVRPSTMSQMLDRLERERWVERVTSSEDSRVRLIRLTDSGRGFIRSVEGLWRDRLSPALAVLTPQEQATLVDLLARVAQASGGSGV
ncbi:MAG: MarR family transcriptional regulator [Firmicutes bacterium]|nr:MarR family transcriptional regulator [Bacillota bacterium]